MMNPQTRFCPQWLCLLLMYYVGCQTIGYSQIPNDDRQRYMGLQMLNLDTSPSGSLPVIQKSIENGCNLVAITIYWGHVYPTATSAADWRQADNQVQLITKMGAKVAIRIMLGRTKGVINGFWTPQDGVTDNEYRQLLGIYDYTSFSFAHQPSVQKAQKFIQEVCERYNYLQTQNQLLYVSFVNTPAQELGYEGINFPNGDFSKKQLASFDYSPASVAGFRKWAMEKYKRLGRINYVWKTRVATENDISPPTNVGGPRQAFKTLHGKDWYLYNHLLIKNYINQNIEIIKKVNPTYKVINEYGSVADEGNMLRKTLMFKDLDKNTDGTKVHDAPYYNHRWHTDIQRSNRPGKWIMNEVFFEPQESPAVAVKQFNECFEHGCKVVTMVVSGLEDTKAIFLPVKNRWLQNPLEALRPQASYQFTVSQVLDSASMEPFYQQYAKIAGSSTSSPKTVDVQITEDILNDDYWKKWFVNVPPVVNYSIADRATKPKKSFSYTLPKDVFSDPDGSITKIDVLEKPAWLSFANNTFSGISPSEIATFKITIRAFDDDSATVQTSFSIKTTNINVKPVVNFTIPNFTSYLNQLVFHPLSATQFDDPDGKIIGIQPRGLRPWMLYKPYEFSAYPEEFGTFTVTLRAYDDDSAFVETSFYIQVLNRPPVVVKTLPEKVIAQGKSFKYRISKTIFSDPEGDIARIKVLNRPPWMAFDGNELSGTPTQLDTYRLVVRAYDSAGDSVETPFVVRVDTRGNLNSPPVVRGTVRDVQVFVTQQFNYKIPDSLFFDSNGYIDRVETPNLPNWLKFKNNEISGLATKPGTYTVTLRAVDDDESSVTASFKVEVRLSQLTFELIQAGKVGTRQLIGPLRNGDVLKMTSLPERFTIYATSEVAAKKVIFKLQGPYNKTLTVEKFPFALFDDETGFAPVAGRYTLQAEAFGDSLKISQTSIQFEIQTDQTLADWQTYPNPFEAVCNLKIPIALDFNNLNFDVVSLNGQRVSVPKGNIGGANQVMYLDLQTLQLPSGVYFLQILQKGTVEKNIKIIKR